MKVDERLPLFVGTLKLVVFDGQKRVVHRAVRTNTIQQGLKAGVAYQFRTDHSNVADFAMVGIDYSNTSGSDNWETGSTYPSVSSGGDLIETYVVHTNSYTAGGAGFTVQRMRMRRKGYTATNTDLATTAMHSLVTGLSVTLQSGWKILTTWRIGVQ